MKIGFLKTLKCAGTSVQNTLLRYSLKHNLNVVLPDREQQDPMNREFDYSIQNLNGIEVQTRFSRKMIEDTLWEKAKLNYQMFMLHTRWNHHEISSTLNDKGQGDVFYFSIIRDPVLLFRSFWDYFLLSYRFDKTLDEYAKTVIRQYVSYNNMTYCMEGYNTLLHDFGMYCHEMLNKKRSKLRTPDHIMNKLEEIDKAFNLILMADEGYYEEGLVLLKHELCWEYEDIINVPHNVFSGTNKYVPHNIYSGTKKSYYSAEARKIIKGTNMF